MGSESLFSQACLAGVANRFLRRNNFDKKKTSTQKTNKNNSAWKTKHISLKLIKTHRTNILCQTSGGFDVIMTSSHTTDTSSEVISSTINSVFIPWDNPENVMSHETYVKFDDALTCYVVPVLFIMGAGGNLLNCAVFWMQGLKERMNLCLFCLALTDLMYVLFHTVMVSYCVVEKLAASVIDVQYYKWYARR